MTLVLNQDENSEYLKLNQSYFKLRCAKMLAEPFNRPNSHLNDWMRSYVCSDDLVGHSSSNVITEMTIAIQRYEYVNLYHTMTDYYNAFLVMLLFQKRPENVNILFIDGHPNGGLDDTWRRLFKQTYRAGALKRKTLFSNLIWGIPGYNSPLNNHELTFVPYLKDFRTFFLRQHNLKNISKTLDCDNLSVLFIWRRDYVAHPRNPSGLVSRKIKNEQELVDHVSKLLPGHDIKSLQLDKLTMQEQLKIVSKTDILIGMHGAGLSHTLFLPNHSGLIELYPIYWPETNRHFRMMATWRGLHYLTWKNHDIANEFPLKFTYVPPQSVGNMVNEMAVKLCQNKLRIR
ncbi:hypothetical protein LOTGIDRAFT_128470 [Lottia gigantea]|uniref:Glycosyltransferase 61 catalytic domain-containing protein n=1 Tax=Lottia gigantea TaxID=225164 RepID=V3Z7H7_LOTGI|nr:hypothetical protein LOTGIDRAFT_128470 [Lottia gigantea]ESO86798.1 hypothetical protein LOTGIDRAFT_128470 [Lottia gigantea]